MSLDRSVNIVIGGKERKIKFNVLAVSQLEGLLERRNIYLVLRDNNIALGDLAKCLYVGLYALDKKVTLNQVYDWMDEYLLDNSYLSLVSLVLTALNKGGIFGNTRNLLETPDADDVQQLGK